MKTCTKCKRELPLTDFHNDKSRKDGLFPWCKQCQIDSRGNYYREVTVFEKRTPRGWISAINKYLYEYGYKICTECMGICELSEYGIDIKGQFKLKSICNSCRAKQRSSRPNSQRSQLELKKQGLKRCCVCGEIKKLTEFWHSDNREKYAYACNKCRVKQNYEYDKQKFKIDSQYRIAKLLRHRVSLVVKQKAKSAPTLALLGCSVEYFQKYFYSLFTGNMTITAFMNGQIHIDHIKACAKFSNLADPTQQKECFHYTNLQPLWAKENMQKGAK